MGATEVKHGAVLFLPGRADPPRAGQSLHDAVRQSWAADYVRVRTGRTVGGAFSGTRLRRMRRRAISPGIGGQVGGGEVDNYRGPFVPT
jgi:hypothetical protein